jgi:hypothetical protein
MTEPQLDKRLQQCTLRLKVSGGHGTGFFVAPGLIITCAHVVKGAGDNCVDVFWQAQNQHYRATIERLLEELYLDLALLRLNAEVQGHPCVYLDECAPQLGDHLFSYGYPQDYPDGDSVTFEYEGESFKGNSPLYKLKAGHVNYGLSGSPLLNQRTGKVCGIVNLSRNPNIDLGGRAVPAKVILAQLPDLVELNRQFHQQNRQRTGANPFEYGPPVPPERFYGRRRAIADVKNRIGAISAQCINIVGQRRNGKSSLLRYIRERTEVFCQREQKPLIVTLDLQDRKFHTPEGIIEGLRRGIKKLTGTEPWARDVNDDPFEVEDGLQALCDNGHRLIVMLDEFEAISRRLEQFQDWGEDWRAKASAGLLTLLIASKRPLSEIYENMSLTSPFSNIFSTTILGALEEEAWHSLVQRGFDPPQPPLERGEQEIAEEPPLEKRKQDAAGQPPFLRGAGGISEAELAWIDDLAGGLPFYTQMAAALLWQHGDREQARTEFIFQATPRFRELWDDLTALERHALRDAAGVSGLAAPNSAITDTLQRHGLLRSDGCLFSSAFAEFVREQR